MRCHHFELVGRRDEGQAGQLGDVEGNLLGEPLGRIQPGTDGGAALRQLIKTGKAGPEIADRGATCAA